MSKHNFNGNGVLTEPKAGQEQGRIVGVKSTEVAAGRKQDDGRLVRQILVPVPVFTRETAYEHGRDVAMKAGDMKASEETVKRLTEHCRSMAKEMAQGKFDPAGNSHDSFRHAEFDRLFHEREEVEHALSLSEAKLRDSKRAASQAVVPKSSGGPRWLIGLAAAGLLAIGFAPTVHDLFFSDEGYLAGWYWAAIVSLALGGGMACLLLSLDAVSDEDDKLFSRKGLWAGTGIAFAFCAARWRDAEGMGEYFFSFALFIYEAAVVVLVEMVLASLRKSKRVRDVHVTEGEKLKGDATSHASHCEELKGKLAMLNGEIEAHISYIEQRNVGVTHTQQIEEALVNAALDGYNAGVTANRGIKLGA